MNITLSMDWSTDTLAFVTDDIRKKKKRVGLALCGPFCLLKIVFFDIVF